LTVAVARDSLILKLTTGEHVNSNCVVCSGEERAVRSKGESRATVVSIITLATMAVEIAFGVVTGSMALLADGIHMGTHALALFVTVLAYLLARKFRSDPGFSFGTGKVGVLGGYTNAILLGVTALFMTYEAVNRLLHPQEIRFDEAILVAIIGLAVNLVCAFLLKDAHDHGHAQGRDRSPEHSHGHNHAHPHDDGHDHGHDHQHARVRDHRHADSNLKGALLHVVSDALTSVLAIAALFTGKYLGWNFLDPVVALLGVMMILRWSWGLLRDTGGMLLDFGDYREETARIRGLLESEGSTVCDIHIWRFSENERSLMLTVRDSQGRSPEEIRAALGGVGGFAHVTVEVAGK
jgi:cation diffusion facilitator family transporter